jgi:hypothetical protein
MRIFAIIAMSCAVAFSPRVCGVASAGGTASLAGFAFVDASVTSQGSHAKLPAGTKIFPPGSKITGAEGCPKTSYGTDGLTVAVIDYEGSPSAGSVAVTRHPVTGGDFEDAPYYLDLNRGRNLQELSDISANGSYDVRFTYNIGEGQKKTISTKLVLARSCR